MNLYEGMFLLDNQVVRADWPKAKALVSDAIAKHGGEVETARRWDERKLCYPVSGRKRATYVLAYYRIGTDGIAGLRRDLELSESVLRYMMLSVEEVPSGEAEKAGEENAEGFSFPAPPEDDEPEEQSATEGKPAAAEKPEKAAAAEKQDDEAEAPKEEPAKSETETETKSDAEAKGSDEGSSDTPNEKVEA